MLWSDKGKSSAAAWDSVIPEPTGPQDDSHTRFARTTGGIGQLSRIADKLPSPTHRMETPERNQDVAKKETVIEIEGKTLKLSNLDKVLYPAVGFTKGQVIDYFVRIAPVLLPHLHDRPLTMKRYPEGVNGMFFYEKNCPKHRPEWVQTAKVWSHGRSDYMQYCLAQDLPTLVWAANLADLELHTSLSRQDKIEQPTMMIFDLDPGPPADIVLCCQVAFW